MDDAAPGIAVIRLRRTTLWLTILMGTMITLRTSGPVIVDESGQFYGRFTASKFVSDRTRIRALNQLTDPVAGGMNLRDAHERFCGD